jgi:hypothetical protein
MKVICIGGICLMHLLLRIFPLAIHNIKSKIYKTVISFAVYGHEIWSLSLSGRHRLKMSDSTEVRGVFIPKREVGERYIMTSLMICMLRQILRR